VRDPGKARQVEIASSAIASERCDEINELQRVVLTEEFKGTKSQRQRQKNIDPGHGADLAENASKLRALSRGIDFHTRNHSWGSFFETGIKKEAVKRQRVLL